MEDKKPTFEEVQENLSRVVLSASNKKDGSGHVLSYASWSDVWGDLIKVCPKASYEVKKFGDNQVPFLKTEEGYMVFTTVTIEGVTREMWLSVMDSHNLAMKSAPYKVMRKSGEITVAAATMNDINYAIMRCLVKNIAMFGLGINFYQGEDLPDAFDVDMVSEPIRCEKCGKEIKDYQSGTSVYSRDAIMRQSLAKFGKALCFECSIGEKQKAQKEEKTNA